MHPITGSNVNEIYPVGLNALTYGGVRQESQHGTTIEMPQPVSVCYRNPRERCLFDPVRDSNPFLNLFEALWILAGREDVKFLSNIVGRMANYADDGVRFYGAYGARMRGMSQFRTDALEPDQIEAAIKRLKLNPDDRQVVITIRQAADMLYRGKDQPCNMIISLKIRAGKLNLHVFNRSNDFIWGMTGTNVVQFSMLQEYLAGRIGCEIGVYHQTTDSMHVYLNDQWEHIRANTNILSTTNYYEQGLTEPYPMMAEGFDEDLFSFFAQWDKNGDQGISRLNYKTPFFNELIFPAWYSFVLYKEYRETKEERFLHDAIELAQEIPADWGLAIREWLGRRGVK